LAKVIEDDFNSLDSHLAVKIVERLATISSRFEIYLRPQAFKTAPFRCKFHAYLLHRDWPSVRALFANRAEVRFDEPFDFLLTMEPDSLLQAIREVPEMTRLHTLLLDSRYQTMHFDSFTNLQSLRYAMKEVIEYPEVLSAYINYCESRHPTLYNQIVKDSLTRINDYFAMRLKSVERKRYKNHPSFIIAITCLDTILERKLDEAQQLFEYFDKESVLRAFVEEMGIMPADSDDYFELAHALQSFREAMVPLMAVGAESQLIPSELDELSIVADSFNIHRVINEGGKIRYELIIQLMKHFKGSLTAGIIPVELLRHFVKSAAFFMIKTQDAKKVAFKTSSTQMCRRRALLIFAIQGSGQEAAIKKLFKNRFPDVELPIEFLISAMSFYRAYLLNSRFIPTNLANEIFIIQLSKNVLRTSEELGSLEDSISRVLSFFSICPEIDTLLIPQLRILISIAYFELQ
jgi:hypothetical protein